MFGKLMKYELRSVMKDFLFIWVGILVLSVVNAFTMSLGNNQELDGFKGNNQELDGFKGFLFVAVPLLVLFCAVLVPQFLLQLTTGRYVLAVVYSLILLLYIAIFLWFFKKYTDYKNSSQR